MNFDFCAEYSVFKRDFDIVTKVCSLPYAAGRSPSETAAEKVFEYAAKAVFAEDVFEAPENA